MFTMRCSNVVQPSQNPPSTNCWIVIQTKHLRIIGPHGPKTPTVYRLPDTLIAASVNTRMAGLRVACGFQPLVLIASASSKLQVTDGGVWCDHLGPKFNHILGPARKQPARLLGRPSHPNFPKNLRRALKLYGQSTRQTHQAIRSASALGQGAIRGPIKSISFPIHVVLYIGSGTLFGHIRDPANCMLCTMA